MSSPAHRLGVAALALLLVPAVLHAAPPPASPRTVQPAVAATPAASPTTAGGPLSTAGATGAAGATGGAAPVAPAGPLGPAAPLAAAAAGPIHPLLATTPAFGGALDIEVRDLPHDAARDAIQAAGAEVAEIERMTDLARPDSELSTLDAAAGKGPRHVDPRLFAILEKALNFCLWSEGKEGPLARDLHRLWGRGSGVPLASPPDAGLVEKAVAAADCRHLLLDGRQHTAALAAGAAVDLTDFRIGMAVDRAMDILRQRGSANAFVKIGPLRRGIGPGRGGRGWQVDLPALGGLREPLGRIFLRDQALALADIAEQPLRVGDAVLSPFIDERSGQPAEGVFATLAATELAVDAQALSATMAIAGTREGEILMGSIRPRPSILWLMGSGSGIPLLVEYRWADLPKR